MMSKDGCFRSSCFTENVTNFRSCREIAQSRLRTICCAEHFCPDLGYRTLPDRARRVSSVGCGAGLCSIEAQIEPGRRSGRNDSLKIAADASFGAICSRELACALKRSCPTVADVLDRSTCFPQGRGNHAATCSGVALTLTFRTDISLI